MVVVVGAGNAGADDGHWQGLIRTGQSTSFDWLMQRGDPTQNKLEIWYEGGPIDVSVALPNSANMSIEPGATRELLVGGRRVGIAEHDIACRGSLSRVRILVHPPLLSEAIAAVEGSADIGASLSLVRCRDGAPARVDRARRRYCGTLLAVAQPSRRFAVLSRRCCRRGRRRRIRSSRDGDDGERLPAPFRCGAAAVGRRHRPHGAARGGAGATKSGARARRPAVSSPRPAPAPPSPWHRVRSLVICRCAVLPRRCRSGAGDGTRAPVMGRSISKATSPMEFQRERDATNPRMRRIQHRGWTSRSRSRSASIRPAAWTASSATRIAGRRRDPN